MKREAAFTSIFKHWARFQPSAAYEVKHTRGRSYFLLRELKQHQIDHLLAAKGPYGFAYKIPDDGIAFKPFDLFVLNGSPAWVAIAYPTAFCVIDIEQMVKVKDTKRTTLTFSDAKDIASFTVGYKQINAPLYIRQ